MLWWRVSGYWVSCAHRECDRKVDEISQAILCAEFASTGFSVDIGLPVLAGFNVKAGEPASATDIGIDVNGVAKVEGKMGSLLRGVTADHDLPGLVRQGSPEFFVNQSKRMLLGNGDVVFEIGVDEDV